MDNMLDLFLTVWSEQQVVEEWRDALLVPIPKKGYLKQCDNWRGISLLDVTANIIQIRLQNVTKAVLPLWQYSFRAGMYIYI